MKNKLACRLAMILVATLIQASIARADLGTCFVLRSTDARLDGDVTQKARKAIIDAYQISDDSDGDLVFVLDIAHRAHGDSYVVRNVKLVFGPWTLHGYKITGDNEIGLARGVTEIVSALRDGAIYELKPGRRESTTSLESVASNTSAAMPNDPYETALIESLHLLAGRGEPRHIGAILKKHSSLVDAQRRFTQPHKPARTDSFTPLQQAVDNARQDTVALLLNMGADVNRSDGMGWTPLHLAARRGHLAVIKLLVQHGADLNAETDAIPASFGVGGSPPDEEPRRENATPSMTPLDLALKSKHADVVEYLKSISK